MTFWAYMLHCRGGAYYVGHTNDLEYRLAQHQAAEISSFTAQRLPVALVWSQEFGTRDEALAAELRIKGWSRAKKQALIRDDWDEVSRLAQSHAGHKAKPRDNPDTPTNPKRVIPSLSRDRPDLPGEEGQSFDKLRTNRMGDRFIKLRTNRMGDRFILYAHPSAAPTGLSIHALAERSGGFVTFAFAFDGVAATVHIPPPAAPIRTENLWLTTCFEAFIGGKGDSYTELNFSPSGEWAAYAFDGYRAGMRSVDLAEPPSITFEGNRLTATLALPFPPGAPLGLSAVVEAIDGDKSYWALAHSPGAPDFHDRHCFVAKLP